jgi:hypothetical protein
MLMVFFYIGAAPRVFGRGKPILKAPVCEAFRDA